MTGTVRLKEPYPSQDSRAKALGGNPEWASIAELLDALMPTQLVCIV